MPAAPLVTVTRSDLVESVHLGHVAVCDASGRLVAWAGDPSTPVFVRSCMKPLQAAVSLAAMGDPLPPAREVAVMCASHNGEPVHVRAVRSLLRRSGLSPDDLRTPPDRPLDADAATRVRAPAPVFHNCSGKHAGMLAACAGRGWRTTSYRSPGHPLQRRVLDAVRLLSGVEPAIGVDGCGVPVHGMRLRDVATMYARLGVPDRQGELAPAVSAAIGAMRSHPYLVGGRGRDDTAVMQAIPGLVMKEGAEALDCAVALEPGLGVAVKVADGGYRGAGPATIAVLEQLGLVGSPARRRLTAVAEPPVLGGGRRVGVLRPVVRLRGRG